MNEQGDAQVRLFLAAARSALPHLSLDRYKVRTFGNSAQFADLLIGLIASGEKTGTYALASEFAARPEQAPVVGDLYVVTHFDGRPALLYRITEVRTVPFEDIGPAEVAVEGPNARDVAVWRRIHWDYWGSQLRAQGQPPSMQMPVIFQRFEILFKA
jgi:uncharacterized protein YhfF